MLDKTATRFFFFGWVREGKDWFLLKISLAYQRATRLLLVVGGLGGGGKAPRVATRGGGRCAERKMVFQSSKRCHFDALGTKTMLLKKKNWLNCPISLLDHRFARSDSDLTIFWSNSSYWTGTMIDQSGPIFKTMVLTCFLHLKKTFNRY